MSLTLELDPLERLGIELLQILMSSYYLRDTLADLQTGDGHSNFRNLKILALLHNDIIVRLGKFREDDNRNWSFRQVAKYVGMTTTTADRAADATPLIKEFVQTSDLLKDYRNHAVAHLTKRGTSHLAPLTEINRLVALAIRVVDVLSGERNEYRVGEVDLRREVLGDANA